MKKYLVVLFFIIAVLALVAASAPGLYAKPTPQVGGIAETPAPGEPITIPGVNHKLYIAGPNPLANTADSHDRVAGLVDGLFHGLISPGTLVVSFFNPNVHMYEVHNNGNQYNLGFMIGVAVIFGVLGIAGGRRW